MTEYLIQREWPKQRCTHAQLFYTGCCVSETCHNRCTAGHPQSMNSLTPCDTPNTHSMTVYWRREPVGNAEAWRIDNAACTPVCTCKPVTGRGVLKSSKDPLLPSNQARKSAIALHLEGHSDFAPDVLGLSGLFGLKILFSDVLRSGPGNRHVEPIRPLCAMCMRVVGGWSTHSRGK